MRKAMTVILWLGLVSCLVLVISLSGQKRALERERADQARKNEALQTLYDEMKDEWTEKEAALTLENGSLLRDKKTLTQERDALTLALTAARQESRTQRQTADALTAERAAASDRLADVLNMLLAPLPQLSAPAEEQQAPPARQRHAPLLPSPAMQPVAFGE